jgi:hypothetical protein
MDAARDEESKMSTITGHQVTLPSGALGVGVTGTDVYPGLDVDVAGTRVTITRVVGEQRDAQFRTVRLCEGFVGKCQTCHTGLPYGYPYKRRDMLCECCLRVVAPDGVILYDTDPQP